MTILAKQVVDCSGHVWDLRTTVSKSKSIKRLQNHTQQAYNCNIAFVMAKMVHAYMTVVLPSYRDEKKQK